LTHVCSGGWRPTGHISVPIVKDSMIVYWSTQGVPSKRHPKTPSNQRRHYLPRSIQATNTPRASLKTSDCLRHLASLTGPQSPSPPSVGGSWVGPIDHPQAPVGGAAKSVWAVRAEATPKIGALALSINRAKSSATRRCSMAISLIWVMSCPQPVRWPLCPGPAPYELAALGCSREPSGQEGRGIPKDLHRDVNTREADTWHRTGVEQEMSGRVERLAPSRHRPKKRRLRNVRAIPLARPRESGSGEPSSEQQLWIWMDLDGCQLSPEWLAATEVLQLVQTLEVHSTAECRETDWCLLHLRWILQSSARPLLARKTHHCPSMSDPCRLRLRRGRSLRKSTLGCPCPCVLLPKMPASRHSRSAH
jgi:hypothetical protein